jgi:glutamate formiminotransferase/formiminotetrahydrofolate cyclodeaminase
MPGPAEHRFLDALAAKNPTPAGGAAAIYAGAMAAALVAMVARTTIGKPQYAHVERRMEKIASDADKVRAQLIEAIERDSAVFQALLAARRLPEGEARDKALTAASFAAAEAPIEAAQLMERVLKMAISVARSGNPNALSDALCAAELSRTGIAVCIMNAGENLSAYATHPRYSEFTSRFIKLIDACDKAEHPMKMAVMRRELGAMP